MMTLKRLLAETPSTRFDFVEGLDEGLSFRDAFLDGLQRRPMSIPPQFLYDSRGSGLFDRICTLPEYYPTRAETAILRRHANDIADLVGPDSFLIELGSGSSDKTRIVLDALDAPAAYAPIDVSREHLRLAASAIACDYPQLRVSAICADYAGDFDLPDLGSRRVAFFPGSTIGNLDHSDAIALLRLWRRRLGADGLMIIGADLKKEADVLEAAYDDAAGVTEKFIKNILVRANRELGANFDPGLFAYEARYSEQLGRVEMHLRSRKDQTVLVAGRSFEIELGERIHVENSHKYASEDLLSLCKGAGFRPAAAFVDDERLFSVEVWAVA